MESKVSIVEFCRFAFDFGSKLIEVNAVFLSVENAEETVFSYIYEVGVVKIPVDVFKNLASYRYGIDSA